MPVSLPRERRLENNAPLLHNRAILLVGFGGLVLLMAYSSINTMAALGHTQERNARIQDDFVTRSRLLNQIRSDLYVSGTYVRDYLLEPEPAKADSYRQDLDRVRRDMGAALETYGRLSGASEAAPFNGLRAQLAQYWNVLDPAMRWPTSERHRGGYGFLRDEVFPRRTAMLRLADEIASLNEQQLNQGSRRVAELFRQVHNTIQATLLFTLLAGIGLAVFSISSILQVEREATARYLETAQARQELKKLSAQLVHAQENERRAISRELHDEVGQAMSALLVGLSGLLVAVPEGARAALAPRVNALREIAENSVRAARNLALLLRPSMLDDLGLMPALHWQAREVARDTGLRVDVASDEVFDNLPDEHKTCIYRVVQEALHNVTRHAQAEVVRINIKQEARAIFLTIQDDGRGFNAQERGLGLLGMNERVANLGGSFTVESHLGRGTLMSVCLPLPQGVET